MEVVALSVDSPGRNEALRRRWHLPFPVLSDPTGGEVLQPLDCWSPSERNGIAWPTMIVFAPDGREILRVRSRDFADRPDDDDLMAAVRGLGLSPITLDRAPAAAAPEEDPAAFRVDAFGPFFRGMRSGAGGLVERLSTEADQAEARTMAAMASSFLDAWRQRRDTARPPQG